MSKAKWENDDDILKGTLEVARNFKSLIEMQIHNKTVQLENMVNDILSREEELKALIKEKEDKNRMKNIIKEREEKIKKAKETLDSLGIKYGDRQ